MPEDDAKLELLLSLDGASYEAAAGYVVEFVVRRTAKTAARAARHQLLARVPAKGWQTLPAL
jgi:Tfp pilus assembly protein PilN